VGASAEGGENVVEGVRGEGMAVIAEVAIAEPVVEEGIGEGEGLVDAREGDEGFAGGGGKGGVLGELHEQVGDGGAMLGSGGVSTSHFAPVSREGCAGGRVDSL
jgi:hypothetical protein